MVSINFEGAKQFYARQPDAAAAQAAFDTLVNGTGAGNDFIGWVDLPVNYDKDEFARIQKAAAKILADSKALVVIGIGGIRYISLAQLRSQLRHKFMLCHCSHPPKAF